MKVKPITGKSPITGDMVDGETYQMEYDSIKNELMQVLRSHKLTAGQALYAIGICEKSIYSAIHSIVDF
jgi:hypothetical protein